MPNKICKLSLLTKQRLRLATAVVLVIALITAIGFSIHIWEQEENTESTKDAPQGMQGQVHVETYKSADQLLDLIKWQPPTAEEVSSLQEGTSFEYGTYNDMLKKWGEEGKGSKRDWVAFLIDYVAGFNSQNRARAFEEAVKVKVGLSSDKYDFKKRLSTAKGNVKPDAFPKEENVKSPAYEFKSGGNFSDHDIKQLDKYILVALEMDIPIVYVTINASDTLKKKIEEANEKVKDLQREKGKKPREMFSIQVVEVVLQAKQIEDPVVKEKIQTLSAQQPQQDGSVEGGNPNNYASDILAAPDQVSADGPLSTADPESVVSDQSGGVDFSTLELRYVSDIYHGECAQFAFRADTASEDQTSYDCRTAAQLASDAFFVWLELPVDVFTVNLNPDEPSRIIDSDFGQTDVGRVLLEADLQMKKVTGKIIHPDTPTGKEFWNALQGEDKCFMMRQWIVPATATVYETDNELFILDAPLEVKMETDYVKTPQTGQITGGCKDSIAASYNINIYKTKILPLVQKAVNTSPEFADLRRVYYSRVAAQWYRDRSATRHTVYSDLIDKGDITPWVSQESWDPKDVFNRYVESYTKGEFTWEFTTTSGDIITTWLYIYGGVDFSTIKHNKISTKTFEQNQPNLAQSVIKSSNTIMTEENNTVMWLGGLTTTDYVENLPTAPRPAPQRFVFYVVVLIPLAIWLFSGVWLMSWRHNQHAKNPHQNGDFAMKPQLQVPGVVMLACWLMGGIATNRVIATAIDFLAIPELSWIKVVYDERYMLVDGLILLGIISVLVAVVYLVLAKLNSHGFFAARIITWVFVGLTVCGGLPTLIFDVYGDVVWYGWLTTILMWTTIIFGVMSAVLLALPASNEFYRSQR